MRRRARPRARRRASRRSPRRPPPSPRRRRTGAGGPRTPGSRSVPRSARTSCAARATTEAGTVWSCVGADDQQRGALRVGEVDLRRRVQREVGEPRLVEDPARLRDGVALVRRRGLLVAERVDEPVAELLGAELDDPVALGRVRERRGGGLQRRERQHEDALGRRRAERDARASQTAVEQQLDDQAAEGVPDQHGRPLQRLDQARVVVDDLVESEPGELRRLLAERLDVAVLARPLGADTSKPRLPK